GAPRKEFIMMKTDHSRRRALLGGSLLLPVLLTISSFALLLAPAAPALAGERSGDRPVPAPTRAGLAEPDAGGDPDAGSQAVGSSSAPSAPMISVPGRLDREHPGGGAAGAAGGTP